jgi:hypothetical protein
LVGFVQMDILAPVLAYFTCVAGIIGAFLVSFYVVFSPPNQAVISQRAVAIVSASTSQSSPSADAKKPVLRGTVADNSAINHGPSSTQKREDTPQPAAGRVAQAISASVPQKLAASETRPKTKVSRAQWRQIVEQERRRRLAYQQDGDFESRFLGYAD